MHAHQMISTHPLVRGNTNDTLIRCIEECFDCAQTCTACADACLGEEMVAELVQCIRLNLDCADICTAAGHIASRRTGSNEPIIHSVWRRAARPAVFAPRSASATPRSTNIAASAPRPAVVARAPVRTRCRPSTEAA